MRLDLQPKLLRFLETREIHGLGESHPVKVDVRIVAATNADLDSPRGRGPFPRRSLSTASTSCGCACRPCASAARKFPRSWNTTCERSPTSRARGALTLDDESLEYLVLYAWPGNVRQLVNEVRRIVAFAEAESIVSSAMLSPEIQASRRTVRVLSGDEPEIRVRLDQPLGDAVDEIEKVMVLRALDRAGGNYENAAKLLGISRKGLFLKRRRWGMQRAS